MASVTRASASLLSRRVSKARSVISKDFSSRVRVAGSFLEGVSISARLAASGTNVSLLVRTAAFAVAIAYNPSAARMIPSAGLLGMLPAIALPASMAEGRVVMPGTLGAVQLVVLAVVP